MNLIRSATVSVSNPRLAAQRFVDWFDYKVIEDGYISPDLACSWSAEKSSGRSYVVVRPISGVKVDIRFVESEPVAEYRPLRTFGWAALEICVQHVFEVEERLKNSPFSIIGPPNKIAVLPVIHPMQVRGPDDEIVYLTEIKQGGPGSGLPDALAPIDKLFICVLGCADMTAVAAWFAKQLGVHIADEFSIPYRMLNQAFELPSTHEHRLTSADHAGDIFLEFDQYPEGAIPRPSRPGELCPGVAICSILHSDIDAIPGPWLTEPVAREGVIYEGQRVGVLRTPEGSLVEVIEMATS